MIERVFFFLPYFTTPPFSYYIKHALVTCVLQNSPLLGVFQTAMRLFFHRKASGDLEDRGEAAQTQTSYCSK